jgi:hypothetical protein
MDDSLALTREDLGQQTGVLRLPDGLLNAKLLAKNGAVLIFLRKEAKLINTTEDTAPLRSQVG